MVRKAMRLPDVLAATGWSKTGLYKQIAEGKFSKGKKLDPDGRIVVWFEDEVEDLQKRAIERQTMASTPSEPAAA